MLEVIGPDPNEELCAGIAYDFEAGGAGICLTIEWLAVSAPTGVDVADVVFSSPNGLMTTVTVPVDGQYGITFQCCATSGG